MMTTMTMTIMMTMMAMKTIMTMMIKLTQIEIERANFGCDFDFNRKQQTRLLEGEYECFFKLHKPITFQVGNYDDYDDVNDDDDGDYVECWRDGDGDDDDYHDDQDDNEGDDVKSAGRGIQVLL